MSKGIWAAPLLGVLALTSACTTIPGMPNEGTASKFNLATVDYVESREDVIADRVLAELERKLPGVLESALADERARLQALETAIVAQQGQVSELKQALGVTEANVRAVAAEVRERVQTLESSTTELQLIANELSTEVNDLPADTLRELSSALSSHLARNPEPAPAPAPEADTNGSNGGE